MQLLNNLDKVTFDLISSKSEVFSSNTLSFCLEEAQFGPVRRLGVEGGHLGRYHVRGLGICNVYISSCSNKNVNVD